MDTHWLSRYAHHVINSEETPGTYRLSEEEIAIRREMTEWGRFETRFARQVLDNARRYRKEQRLTAQQLSERLRLAGWPLSVSSINGMLGKKGRHSITITEVLALASALGVPPINMILPVGHAEDVEVLPDYRASIYLATMGFIGIEAWRGFYRFPAWGEGGPIHYVQRMLEAYTAEYEMYESLRFVMQAIARGDETRDNAMFQVHVDRFRSTLWVAQGARKAVRAEGMEPDVLDPLFEWIDQVRPDTIDLTFLRRLLPGYPRLGDGWPNSDDG